MIHFNIPKVLVWFFGVILLSACRNSTSEPESRIDYLYKEHISPIVNSFDATSSSRLYHDQIDLILPIKYYSKLKSEFKAELAVNVVKFINELPTLDELRANNDVLSLDAFYLDSARSGSGDRKVFPTVDAQGKIYFDPLSSFQFSYFISQLIKEVISSASEDFRALASYEQELVSVGTFFLLEDVVSPAYSEVEAGWYRTTFANYRDRIASKLDWLNRPELQIKSYYKAFTDHDLFLLAVASDLSFITTSPLFNDSRIVNFGSILTEMRSQTRLIMDQRVTDFGGYFLFELGAWDDHPDHAYADYLGDTYPSVIAPRTDGTWDSSHAHRFPLWFLSFRDGFTKDSIDYLYFDDLILRLANQFSLYVVQKDGGRVVLSNYMDGWNGWYRVNNEWGYGPYTLSKTALWGSWAVLATYSEDVREFNVELKNMILSKDKELVAHRIKFFGERDYKNSVSPRGLRTVDDSGPGSKFELYFLMADELGWL